MAEEDNDYSGQCCFNCQYAERTDNIEIVQCNAKLPATLLESLGVAPNSQRENVPVNSKYSCALYKTLWWL